MRMQFRAPLPLKVRAGPRLPVPGPLPVAARWDKRGSALPYVGIGSSGSGQDGTHGRPLGGSRTVRPLRPGPPLVAGILGRQADPALLRQLWKLDDFDFLLLDDLSYLSQRGEKSEALFALIAERYERRSLGITSNLVFSEWEHIFANPMATAAAIDRVVHHSVILEFDVPSYRTGVAQQRGREQEVNWQE